MTGKNILPSLPQRWSLQGTFSEPDLSVSFINDHPSAFKAINFFADDAKAVVFTGRKDVNSNTMAVSNWLCTRNLSLNVSNHLLNTNTKKVKLSLARGCLPQFVCGDNREVTHFI